MLISIEVKNFRSFYEKTLFSMEAGTRLKTYTDDNVHKRNKAKLIKSAFIFGGNANGKTNIINIFKLLKGLVLWPTRSEIDSLVVDTFADNAEPTAITIKFLKNEKVFVYEIEYVKEYIIRESLMVNGNVIFSRDEDKLIVPAMIEGLKQTIRKNQLLLFFAQSNNVAEAKEAFEWFARDVVILPTAQIGLRGSIAQILKQDDRLKEKIIAFLQAADFNIADIELRERIQKQIFSFKVEEDTLSLASEDDAPERKVTDIYCVHQESDNSTFVLNLNEESAGTKIFLLLAVHILKNRGRDKVFLIDEFDSSLHIKLTEVLMMLFNKWNKGSQFVVTTHSFDLMDKNLRPDQIFFVEKDRYGKSELYSLFDFDDPALRRHDYKYKRRYIQGLYGADQIVNLSAIAEVLGVDYE